MLTKTAFRSVFGWLFCSSVYCGKYAQIFPHCRQMPLSSNTFMAAVYSLEKKHWIHTQKKKAKRKTKCPKHLSNYLLACLFFFILMWWKSVAWTASKNASKKPAGNLSKFKAEVAYVVTSVKNRYSCAFTLESFDRWHIAKKAINLIEYANWFTAQRRAMVARDAWGDSLEEGIKELGDKYWLWCCVCICLHANP